MLDTLLLWGVGVIVGAVMANLLRLVRTTFGTLRIDCSNPEKDTYSLEIDDLDKLAKSRRVILEVVKHQNDSQN